jgi:phosphatidyl-myo-inositol dimannoside synthase
MATGKPARRIEEIVHVSAGMREDGGGTAHLGRLIGASMRRSCAQRGLRFRGFQLPDSDGGVATDGYRAFGNSKRRLTIAILWHLLWARGRAAYFFDHIGPARSFGVVPDTLLPPFAIQIHGIEVWRELSRDRLRILEMATLVVANSEYTARRAADFLPERRRLRVVQLGIEPQVDVGRPDRGTLAEAGEGFALIVGRTALEDRYKGHDALLEVWTEVRRRVPGARLVVVGSGTDLARLRVKASSLDLGDCVVFTGRVDSPTLAELYRRAAFFVMPSRLEGFGLVFAEAMASGKACLAIESTAPAEIIEHGRTGLLVPSDSSEALGDGIVRLFSDREATERMGETGRRRYEERFTADAFASRLLPVLDELVES